MRYEVFLVDCSPHPICAAKLDYIDEQSARYRAEQMSGEHDVELWEGDRSLRSFEPVGTSGQLDAERLRLHCSSGT